MENEGGTWSGAYVAWVLPRDDGPDIPIYTTLFEGQGGYEGLSALCQSTYPKGRGWDGESECVLFPGPSPPARAAFVARVAQQRSGLSPVPGRAPQSRAGGSTPLPGGNPVARLRLP